MPDTSAGPIRGTSRSCPGVRPAGSDPDTEPDGTHKRYFLQVPPTVRTPREAVAWTYGLSERQYRPVMRTWDGGGRKMGSDPAGLTPGQNISIACGRSDAKTLELSQNATSRN